MQKIVELPSGQKILVDDEYEPGGPALLISGVVENEDDLPPLGRVGDFCITADTGHGWTWDTGSPGEWMDVGEIQGAPGATGAGHSGASGSTSREGRRREEALRRGKAAFGDDGLVAHYRKIGDALIEFADIARLVIEAMPDKTLSGLTHLFVFSTKIGAFPASGSGLGPHDTVKDLFDCCHLRASLDADFTPSLAMVELAPRNMRARS